MITSPLEYISNLNIVNSNPPQYIALDTGEVICNIDTKLRTVDAPGFIGVTQDHAAETIYFSVDRYVGYMDLANTCCIIWYINAAGKAYNYHVPFFDIYTYQNERKIVFPWNLEAPVFEKEGPVSFAIQFFTIGDILNNDGEAESVFTYNLNTLPAVTMVKQSMEVNDLNSDYLLKATEASQLRAEVAQLKEDVNKEVKQIYWTMLD